MAGENKEKKRSAIADILQTAREGDVPPVEEKVSPKQGSQNKAGNTVMQKAGNTAKKNTTARTPSKPAKSGKTNQSDYMATRRSDEQLVHITIEVPISHRKFWKIESARLERSFKDVAVEAFTKVYGLPEEEE